MYQHPRSLPALQYQSRNLLARLHGLQDALERPSRNRPLGLRASRVSKLSRLVLELAPQPEASAAATFAHAAHKAAWTVTNGSPSMALIRQAVALGDALQAAAEAAHLADRLAHLDDLDGDPFTA